MVLWVLLTDIYFYFLNTKFFWNSLEIWNLFFFYDCNRCKLIYEQDFKNYSQLWFIFFPFVKIFPPSRPQWAPHLNGRYLDVLRRKSAKYLLKNFILNDPHQEKSQSVIHRNIWNIVGQKTVNQGQIFI